MGGGGLEVLLLEPQPQRTNEMIARQKRLGTAFNGDIVRRELRPARRGKDWETPTQILDFSPLTAVQESPHENVHGKRATETGAL
jgi:hypothetical protein